jgi:hypothetical protein
LAAKFGADQSFKFVNGVLDRASRDIRVHEQTATTDASSDVVDDVVNVVKASSLAAEDVEPLGA